jgi:glycosyltransferase involved in cell wall biosynthesis
MAQVAIVIPLMRPHRIKPVVDSIAETTEDYRIVVVATGKCADAARDLPVMLVEDEGGTYPVRINKGFAATDERYVMLAADDLRFYPGWFEAVMRAMEPIDGVVAVNDLHNPAGVHFATSRTYVDTFGGTGDNIPGVVLCEQYTHCWCDDEFRNVAGHRGRFAYANDAIVEHLHVGNHKAPDDAVYQMGAAAMSHDLAVYTSRQHLWQ